MNRVQHLKETLPENLKVVRFPLSDFVLLNYNSGDNLHEWVLKNFKKELKSGKLKYFKTSTPQTFKVCHAKNAAHKLATGIHLVNLDADNYITKGYISSLLTHTSIGNDVTWFPPSESVYGGGMGRISIRKDIFLKLGGYDELMFGWGYEDQDLVKRAEAFGYKIGNILPYLSKFIKHDDSLRITPENKSDVGNRNKSVLNIKRKRLVANVGKTWGEIELDNF